MGRTIAEISRKILEKKSREKLGHLGKTSGSNPGREIPEETLKISKRNNSRNSAKNSKRNPVKLSVKN